MGLKEKMAEMWMGNMTPEEKQEMMDSMMENFFAAMSAEEKRKTMETMMEKFMGGLSAEEKQALIGTMMPKMMSGMMGGQESPQKGMMGAMILTYSGISAKPTADVNAYMEQVRMGCRAIKTAARPSAWKKLRV